jgi:hypothetical protein
MEGSEPAEIERWHRFMAAHLFNETWSYLGKPERSAEEDQQMLWAAMGSRFHWLQVGDQTNFAVGDWQLSRVFSVLDDLHNARRYAASSLRRCHQYKLGPFLTAYAHEALARVAALADDAYERDRNRDDARALADQVEDETDRKQLLDDLASI